MWLEVDVVLATEGKECRDENVVRNKARGNIIARAPLIVGGTGVDGWKVNRGTLVWLGNGVNGDRPFA